MLGFRDLDCGLLLWGHMSCYGSHIPRSQDQWMFGSNAQGHTMTSKLNGGAR